MLKLIGVGMVWCGCVFCGLRAAWEVRNRIRYLEDIARGMEILKRDLSMNKAALPQLLKRAGGSMGECGVNLFIVSAAMLEKENTFTSAWTYALDRSGIEGDDRRLLEPLPGVLGRYDVRGQLEALEQMREQLNQHTDQLRQRAQGVGKVYGILGAAAGGFLSLALL